MEPLKIPSASSTAAKGALYSSLLRILSFVSTQFIYRVIDPRILGQVSIRMELFYSSTILFLGREGFRLSLSKYPLSIPRDETSRKLENVAWVSVLWSFFLGTIAITYHLFFSNESDLEINRNRLDYKVGGILYIVATLIEILAEPIVISCLRGFDVKTRVKAEAVATLGKASSILMLAHILPKTRHISLFGLAQCLYSIAFTFTLYKEKMSSLSWPAIRIKDRIKDNFDMPALWLALMFTGQSLMKHFLTEGDRIVLTAYADSYDAGIYALVISYGGIASRLIFQPLEENGRTLFSKQHTMILQSNQRDKNHQIYIQQRNYCALVKLVITISIVFAVFGSNYTTVLLNVLAGTRWGSNHTASDTLSVFCWFIIVMSLNGMTEAFVYGVACNSAQVGSITFSHLIIGCVFYTVAPFLMYKQGTVGLLLSNSLCMLLRSLYSLHFANKYFTKHLGIKKVSLFAFVRKISPNPFLLLCSIFCYGITSTSRFYVYNESVSNNVPALFSKATYFHLFVGVVTFGLWCISFYYSETKFRDSLREMTQEKQSKLKIK